MLEKIGLPAKPSARGRSWVLDASHCQQCATAFSFFNRKHHCRRCGGIFCGTCVQSRMVLRGQGEAPVRVCEPCKKLEEAARFEARYGRKKKDETDLESEDILKSLLKETLAESPSSSGSSGDPVSPELLRQNAQEEKQRYVALKREGRNEEALKAFKRSKEMERQADALALALRKSSRKASKALKTANSEPAESFRTQTVQVSSTPKKLKSTGEDDVLNELKELGWSDADLNKKQTSDADILGGDGEQKPGKAAGALQMEILGHKRKALGLKREGKLGEAKEELKKAKVLERRLEEIQTLGEDEDEEDDDGDELTAVLKALEKEAELPVKEVPLSKAGLPVFTEDDDDENVDVTDTDMADPDLVAALEAMGWADESGVHQDLTKPPSKETNRVNLQAEILSHKRKALALKRAGNIAEARKELNEAKSLQQMLESSRPEETETAAERMELVEEQDVVVTEKDMHDPEMLAALQALGFGGDDRQLLEDIKINKADKIALQEEVIAVKWSEAALRHQRQQVYNGSVQQLKKDGELYFDAGKVSVPYVPLVEDDEDEEDPIKHIQDLTADPELAAMLKGLTLDERSSSTVATLKEQSTPVSQATAKATTRVSRPPSPPLPGKSKREIQQELLGMKRNALTLRREGKTDEAENVLKESRILEMQLKALEETEEPPEVLQDEEEMEYEDVTEDNMNDPALLAALSAIGFKEEVPLKEERPVTDDTAGFEGEYGEIGQTVDIIPPFFSKPKEESASKQQTRVPYEDVSEQHQKRAEKHFSSQDAQASMSSNNRELEQEILVHKRKALGLKRSGDKAGALEELRLAKELEKRLQVSTSTQDVNTMVSHQVEERKSVEKRKTTETSSQPSGGFKDRMKLQRESLAHKRKAMTLRREGKTDEADAEFEIAKSLEKQLEEMEGYQPATLSAPGMLDDELMDPQLAAALAGLGLAGAETANEPVKKEPESMKQQIQSLKLRAVELKRAGNKQEALDALRQAKKLENRL